MKKCQVLKEDLKHRHKQREDGLAVQVEAPGLYRRILGVPTEAELDRRLVPCKGKTYRV